MTNLLDTDSDDDGCSDAYEAGATADQTANYQFTDVAGDADGLSPTVDPGGYGTPDYTATLAQVTDEIANCPCPYGSGIDVDGDGFCDDSCIEIQVQAWLEGPYNSTLGEMTNTLSLDRKLLPGQTPTSGLGTPTSAGQPYATAPWNYPGTEGVDWTNANYTANETDWLLVSFRTGIEKDTEVTRTAALLMKDGTIQFPDPCVLPITVTGPLYIVIEHRSHIGIMTPQPIEIINHTLSYDFRTSDSYKDAASVGQKEILPGTWVMFAGDGDQSDFPSYDIKGTDKSIWLNDNGLFQQYIISDYNLDGDVNGADKALWDLNNGVSSRVPK